MEYAYVRNGANGEYVWQSPVPFSRIPNIGEYIWINSDAYLVQAVSHSWNNGQPVTFLDISQANSQKGLQLSVTGAPKVD